MKSPQEILGLCDGWWNAFNGPRKPDIREYAEQFLLLIDWDEAEEFDSSFAGASYRLTILDGRSVAMHFLYPASLEPPTAIRSRGLDYCESTLLLANEAKRDRFAYLFATDFNRAYVYDTDEDELILFADAPSQLCTEVLPELCREALTAGSLSHVRRDPRSYSARQLREWCQRWSERVREDESIDEEAFNGLSDRLVLLRFLFERDVLEHDRWDLRSRFVNVITRAFGASNNGCGRTLLRLFEDLSATHGVQLLSPDKSTARILGNEGIAKPMLKEFALLARAKFSISTILESFNYGDPGEKARVRIVPDTEDDRDALLAAITLDSRPEERITIDVLEDGYRVIGHWLDKVDTHYGRLLVEERMRVAPRGISDSGEADFENPLRLAIEQGMLIFHASPRQYRTARLLTYLYAIESVARRDTRLAQLPHIESALAERPAMFESDKRIHQSEPEYEQGWGTM